MKTMSTEAMAGWLWATQHPYLHTFIEIGTSPALFFIVVAGRLIDAWV